MIKGKKCYVILILFLLINIVIVGCVNASNNNTLTIVNSKERVDIASDIPEINKKGTIVILATGGTIAGTGEEGKETGYMPGSLNVKMLIDAVPGIDTIANIEVIQVCNINSDDITSSIWIDLAKKINELAKNENISGFVITHGTETM